ncbi:MAG: hypothetical protein DYG89_10375 [Caldilinea sp. CFX5]|nr:hypothetical protein [Caldilinea sp. CFX5]
MTMLDKMTNNKIIQCLFGILVCIALTACVTAIDSSLPYEQLPEITIATEVTLIASPSQPTSELPFEPIPAGATAQVIGTDQDAAWLLVLYNDQVGWLPTVFSRTNVATLQSAMTFEPLTSDCAKYIDATVDLAQEWTSTTEGSLLVLGSLYRPQSATDFTDASLSIAIEGSGTVVDADYLHTPLTPTSAIVFFVYKIDDLQKGDLLRFQVANPTNEPLAFQATYFSASCQPDLKKLPIGTVKTISPASTAPQAEAVQQTAPAAESPVIVHGTYIWSVRATNIDDASAIFVNGEMVTGGVYWDRRGQTDWVDITEHVIPGQDTRVTMVSLNGISEGAWGFFLRRGETIIWGQEAENATEHAVQYAKTIIITADGEIEEAEAAATPTATLAGEWIVHVQDMDDVGIVLVNGQPVGGGFLCRNCPSNERQHPEAIDITSWLEAGKENSITLAAWTIDNPYSYRFALERDGTPIWQQDKSGETNAGLVFSEVITITAEGELQLASAQPTSASEQVTANLTMADNECNVLPAERCIPAAVGFDGWSVGVLDQINSGDGWAAFTAGDPMLLFHEGKFHLWFVGRATQNSDWSIGYASSVDGIDWEVYSSPVLMPDGAGTWEGTGIGSPSVIVKDGHFEMYYHGGWPASFGLATSDDGINWEKSSRNPVLRPNNSIQWMSYNLFFPSVIYNGESYQMWFAATGGVNWQDRWQIGYAESTDGYNWQIPSDQPVVSLGSASSWKSQAIISPDVVLIGNTYHMWYAGRTNPQIDDWRIGHATSPDGLTWTDDFNNPIFGLGAADGFASGQVANPSIALSGEGYHLWYSGARTGSPSAQIGLATSKDGVRWLR